jgi:hypothetical protein
MKKPVILQPGITFVVYAGFDNEGGISQKVFNPVWLFHRNDGCVSVETEHPLLWAGNNFLLGLPSFSGNKVTQRAFRQPQSCWQQCLHIQKFLLLDFFCHFGGDWGEVLANHYSIRAVAWEICVCQQLY